MEALILLLIPYIVVMVYDYSDFPRTFLASVYSLMSKRTINKELVKLPKLLECSYCATFWLSLIYQLIVWDITLFNVFMFVSVSLGLAFVSPFIYAAINIVAKLFNYILYKTNEKIK